LIVEYFLPFFAYMHIIFYFTIGCAILGAMGVGIANINMDGEVIRRRWTKYYSYIFTTLVVIISIFTKLVSILTILIILAGYFEIIRAVLKYKNRNFQILITSLAGYTLIAAGFLFFSFIFAPYFLFSIYLQVLMFDIFSQVAGTWLGRRAIGPAMDRAKTVEGVTGGFIFCVITALIVSGMLNAGFTVSLFIGVLTATTAVTGDMLANWFKRRMSIRQYSKLLPGQGGFLDRFDGYMVTGLVYYCLAITVLKDLLAPFLVPG
jgi:phosphatidate cytidylyltransferase